MAWNEPGKSDDNEHKPDPWRGDKKPKSDGPPDLDEAFRKFQQKLNGLFGKSSGSKGSKSSGGGASTSKGGSFGIILLVVVVIAVWFLAGLFVVQPAQRATILRFGKYVETVGPGLHWIPRFVDSATKVNVEKVYTYTYPSDGDANMLTKDENIISVSVNIQYRIDNPEKFLYNLVNPLESLHQATASALRQAVGVNDLDVLLTTGREKLRDEVSQQLNASLKRYQSGILVTNVSINSARSPEEVRAAFDDAIKAREDEKRYLNQAEAYALRVEPIAKGHAARIIEAAKAYSKQVVLNAQANTASYIALLPEYQKAPELMRERMYLEAMEDVFSKSSKVLVDTKSSNNLLYLPLDKLLSQATNVKPKTLDLNDDLKITPTATQSKAIDNMSTRPSRFSDNNDSGRGGY